MGHPVLYYILCYIMLYIISLYYYVLCITLYVYVQFLCKSILLFKK